MAADKKAPKKTSAKKAAAKLEVMQISDLETMKVLTDPNRLAILESLRRPASVTEIAERLDVPRTRLYHHIKLLEEHEIIRVAGTRQKGALAEKLYETTADSYAPGPELLESEDAGKRAEAIVTGILDTTREDLKRSIVKYGLQPDEVERKQIVLNRGMARLTPDEAKALVDEMLELWKRYGKLNDVNEEAEGTRLYANTWLFYPSSRGNN
ncbi:MAG: ArsR/SmtB family transcription factor [Acidimicrobiia bacterium]